MNELKSWVVNICTAVFFITAVEMILPDNKMKKYAKFVLGLILITVMINPLVKFINNGMDISTYITNTNSAIDKYIDESKTKEYQEKGLNDTMNVFKSNLEKATEKKLQDKFTNGKYKVTAEVTYDKESSEFVIKSVSVGVTNTGIEKVKKVDIKANSNQSMGVQDESELGSNIRTYLSGEMQVSKDIIKVYKLGT